MTKQYQWLEHKLDQYLQDLGTPNPQLNGWAICPWTRTYRNKISTVIVKQGIKAPIENAFQMLEPLGLMAVVLAFPKKPSFAQLQRTVDGLLNQPEHDNIECLLNNHRNTGTWRGVYTGFKYCDLVIVQDRNKLYWARQNLKNRGYYNQKNEIG